MEEVFDAVLSKDMTDPASKGLAKDATALPALAARKNS